MIKLPYITDRAAGHRDGLRWRNDANVTLPRDRRELATELMDRLFPGRRDQRAIDAVNDFTRARMREEGFYRRIMPPLQLTNDQLDRSISTDTPVRVVDVEPQPLRRDDNGGYFIPFRVSPTTGRPGEPNRGGDMFADFYNTTLGETITVPQSQPGAREIILRAEGEEI